MIRDVLRTRKQLGFSKIRLFANVSARNSPVNFPHKKDFSYELYNDYTSELVSLKHHSIFFRLEGNSGMIRIQAKQLGFSKIRLFANVSARNSPVNFPHKKDFSYELYNDYTSELVSLKHHSIFFRLEGNSGMIRKTEIIVLKKKN